VEIQASREELESAALADAKVRRHTEGGTVKKVMVVPRKLINIVIQ
jgi:leucyl-tRNA synthetase